MAKKKKSVKKEPAPEARKPKKTLRDLRPPVWVIYLIVAVVLVVIVFVRFSHLSNDPPVDIFWSQDVYTDPPTYTAYARNAVLFGDWNPLNDPRMVMQMKNTMGALAYIVFSVLGTGVWQSNLTGVLFSLGAIIFISLAVARFKNRTAGILCAFLLGLNYVFLSYGRVPFLENAMNFWLALAVFFAARGLKQHRWLIAAGVACGVGAFFGKIIALHALPVFLIFAGFIGWRDTEKASGKKWLLPPAYLAAGFAVVAIFWLLYAYLPAGENVRQYLSEQSTGLYGSPEGLKSVEGFFNRIFSFGADTRLFVRLPVLAIFGFIGAALALLPLAKMGRFTDRLRELKPEYLLVGLWFWTAYLALMPWNYRPLRYETVLLVPLAGAAAMILSDLTRRFRGPIPPAVKLSLPWAAILGALLFTLPVYHLVTAAFVQPQIGQAIGLSALLALVLALAGSFILSVSWKKVSTAWKRVAGTTRLPEIIIALAVLATLGVQGRMITGWWQHSQHALVSASRSLKEVLGSDAVLVGSYATGLSLENQMLNVMYMFGEKVNYTLFKDYPITHLAIIDNTNDPAFKNYPDVAGRGRRVTSYRIGNRDVGIFRVAENSPNEQARTYQPTAFEEAMRCYDLFNEDSMYIFFDRFAQEYPDNYNLARTRGFLFWRDSTFDSASLYFTKAVEQYPDDFALRYRLGECEMELFRQTRHPSYLENAQMHFREILRLVPNDPRWRERLALVLNR